VRRGAPSSAERGGVGSQSPADFVLQFSRVLGSSVVSGSDGTQGVNYSVEGVARLDLSDPSSPRLEKAGNRGERNEEGEVYGSLGIVSRPLPPGPAHHAETVCVRTVDGLVPIGARDLRLAMGGAGPGPGTIGLVGYGGSFFTMRVVDEKNERLGSVHALYCPYDYSGSTPQKAHAVVLDPTEGNESVSVVHADGMSVVMGGGKLTLRSNTGAAWIELDGGNVTISGNVKVVGGLQFGGVAGVFPVALVGAPPGTPIAGGPSTIASGL